MGKTYKKSNIELVGIQFENVRGFYNSYLPLEDEKTLIVGRNHAGKTSGLLLLAWFINDADPKRLAKQDNINFHEQQMLLPARHAHHRARRITLEIYIPDKRRHQRFQCDDSGVTALRIGVRVSGTPYAFIQLGPARRESGAESEPAAVELLREIQSKFAVLHIPAARDATSVQFIDRFQTLFRNRLAERALHPGTQSGSTSEFRQIIKATNSLEALAKELIEPLLDQIEDALPHGLLQKATLGFRENAQEELLDWIVDRLKLMLVTGEHDDAGVSPSEVGAGLQSVLDIAAASMILSEADEKRILVAVEEPESYLHPSAQRIVARKLLSENYGYKTLISTHSPVFVEEAEHSNLLMAVERQFIDPSEPLDQRQSDIHSALLSGYGAEMVFASFVLFVEGEGDRAFFEGLRRRLAEVDEAGLLDQVFVLPVGGCERFGPWIRLLNSLNNSPDPAIRYVIVPDGDAVSQAHEAFTSSGLSVPADALEAMRSARENFANENLADWLGDLRTANELLADRKKPISLCFLNGDLEHTMLCDATAQTCKKIAALIGIEYIGKNALIKKLGSKAIDGSGGDQKAPWMRKIIAEQLPGNQLSDNTRDVFKAVLWSHMQEADIDLLFESV